ISVSRAVRKRSRLMSCSASPMERRASIESWGWPKTEISPSLIRSRLQTALISVVLPAPLGPSRPKNAPAGISRLKFSRATVPSSYCLLRSSRRRAGCSRNTATRLAVAAVPLGAGYAGSERCPILPLVVLPVLTGPDRAPPRLVLPVPVDGHPEAVLEADLRLPAELLAELGARQGVAADVAGVGCALLNPHVLCDGA